MNDAVNSKLLLYKTKLEESLFSELNNTKIKLPDNLVKVTSSILSKMFVDHLSFELLEIIGYGSIWAWTLDEITDNPKIPIIDKKPFLSEYVHLFDNVDFSSEIKLQTYPETAKIMVDCINKILKYTTLNALDIKLLKDEYIDCLKGFEYETLNMGTVVPLEDSLYYRSYSYVPPLYGAMIYVCDYHITDGREYNIIRSYLQLFGLITRLHNDFATYKKEMGGKEINLILLLMTSGLSEQEALIKGEMVLNNAISKFNEIGGVVQNESFKSVINSFIKVHGEMYKIDNVRIIDPKII